MSIQWLTQRWTISLGNAELSLRNFDRLADRIRQHRQASDQAVLIVEGPSDELILRDHVEAAMIFPADGKVNAIDCARTLKSWDTTRFICITDRDFDDPATLSDLGDSHFPYTSRDLEAMLVGMGVLASVIEYLGSRDKLDRLGGSHALVQRLEKTVLPVAYLRYRSSRENWGLSFDDVDLASKIDRRSLALKIENYCAALVQASATNATIPMLTAAVVDANIDDTGARGKDIVTAAVVALRHVAGSLHHAVGDAVLLAQLHSSSGLALANSVWLKNLKNRLQLES